MHGQPAANFHQPTFIFASLDTKLREPCTVVIGQSAKGRTFCSSHLSPL
jgi:hypothetical protein